MDTVATIGRLLVSLAAVLGVMWLLARRARKGMKGKSNRVIEVLDRATISRNASVAVVRVNDQAFVLGVAESQVSILGETDLVAALAAKDDAAQPRSRRAASTHRAPRTVPVNRTVPTPRVADPQPVADRPLAGTPQGALSGSALSPQTWKQTIESLRDLTTRA